MKKNEIKLISVTRSFSYKQSLGNYQMAEYFCSQTAETSEKDAEKVSEALHLFCKKEVIKSMNEFARTGMGEKIDMSKMAENMPKGYFKVNKANDEEREAMAHAAQEAKREQKYSYDKESNSFNATN